MQAVERRRQNIARKIHPALPIILRQCSEALAAGEALGKHRPPELVDEICSHSRQKLTDALKEYPTLPYQPLLEAVYKLEPETEWIGMTQFLHFHRHGRSLAADRELANGRDTDAWNRLIRVEQDFAAYYCGKGPIKPSKINGAHADIFLFGSGLGLEDLTEEELADFFDRYCWCRNREAHDGKDLKRQYVRTVLRFIPPESDRPTVFA